MLLRRRFAILVALLALVALTAACGAPADEAPEPPPAKEETPTPEPPPVQPEPEPEPQQPEQPQLVGDIRLSGEDFVFGTPESTSAPAPYTWTVRVTNDTTQTLDITIRFDLLDENDRIVKTERQTIRLAPAASNTIEEQGSIPYSDASRVVGYQAQTERWEIVD